MPLSDHEQRMLQQMEQALYAEDPQFATKITNHGLGQNRRRIVLGVLIVLGGLTLVVLAAMNQLIWLGAVGFGLLVAGGAYALTPRRSAPVLGTVDADGTVRTASDRGRQQAKGAQQGFMQRLEDRWERRRHDEW